MKRSLADGKICRRRTAVSFGRDRAVRLAGALFEGSGMPMKPPCVFWQEIYDDTGRLVEIHEKFPVDKGHQKV